MKRRAGALVGVAIAVVFGGCQVIAGLEDRTLADTSAAGGAPSAGGSAAGGKGGNGASGGASGGGGASGKGGLDGGSGTGGVAGASGKAGAGGMKPDGCMPMILDGGSVTPPPAPADGGKAGNGLSLSFAARRIFLGTIVPDPDPTKSIPDFTAWKQIGYDVDARCTTVDGGSISMPSCIPQGTATNDLITDGNGCRDNAFGRFIAEKLGPLSPEKTVNDKIEQGSPTLLLELDDVDPGPCDPHAPGRLYVAAKTPSSPWLTAEPRKVDGRSVCGNALDAPKMSFPGGYIVGDTWVSGPFLGSPSTLYFPLGDTVVKFHAKTFFVTATLSPDHTSIVSSTMEAIVDPKELLGEFKPIALLLNNCQDPGAIISAYVDGMLQYSDLTNVPGFASPNKTCDLMSLAFGLAWTPVKPSVEVTPMVDQPLPCDAGAPIGGSGGGAGAGGFAGAGGALEDGCPSTGGAGGKAGASGAGGAGAKGGAGGAAGKAGASGAGGAGGP